MLNHDNNFSYQSDVKWLADQARPYYYGIILILIYFDFYLLAFCYSIAAISLIWDIDEVDRIDESLSELSKPPGKVHRIVNLEIMTDYLENIIIDPVFSTQTDYFNDYYNYVDQFLLENSDLNFFLFDLNDNQFLLFDKTKIIKLDDSINKAVLSRENNYDLLKEKLMEFKIKNLSVEDPAKRVLAKLRMKKLLELSAQFEHDLLVYKISVESHNTVLLDIYLKMGLYPISEYDFDLIIFSEYHSIVYFEYLLFYSYKDNIYEFDYFLNEI